MKYIYHIVNSSVWEKAQETGKYAHPSLETEGFIHCSMIEQLIETANKYYLNQTDLLLLEIDPEKLIKPVRYERSESRDADFPHIYGDLNTNAVVKTYPLAPPVRGSFMLPEELI